MLTILDYGVGNLASIQNMLKKANVAAEFCSDEEQLSRATKIILPGVGAFDTCAERLKQSGLLDMLNKKVLEEKTPVLGICVGMQLLTEGSEEGTKPGLAWVPGRVVKFKKEVLPPGYKTPHMGWSEVILKKPSRLFDNMHDTPRFYFVHSYHAELIFQNDILMEAHYGYQFTAGLEHGNILGVQFHPEKSHKFGMKVLENFATYY